MYTASLLAASCAVRGVEYDFVQSFCWLASQSGLLASLVSMENCITLQSGAATRSEGFVVCLLKVLLTCLRRISAAVQPNSKQNYQKTFYKIFGTSCRPRLYISYILKSTLYGGYGSSQQTNHALQWALLPTMLLGPFTGPETSKQHAMMGITHLVIGA